MPFDISYNGDTGQSLYANLFSSKDDTMAWNPSLNDFGTYSLSNQSNFALELIEDSERLGWYKYTISDTTNIPVVQDDEFYFIEVRVKGGTSFDRENDCLAGEIQSYYGAAPGGGLTAKQIWEYVTRSLTQDIAGATAQQIWEYANRTLTQLPPGSVTAKEIWEYASRSLTDNPNCNSNDIIAAINDAILKLTNVSNTNTSDINKNIKDSETTILGAIEDCCNKASVQPKPIISAPVITPNTRGPESNIR